jgi:general secretion pathway protein H
VKGRRHTRLSRSGADARSGFTLFELLMAMTVAVLILGAVSVLYRSPSSSSELKAAALTTASRLRDLRAAAMSSRAEKIAVIDIASRRIGFGEGRPPIALGGSVALSVTAADDAEASPSRALVRFYPNGGSSGGAIAFRSQGQGYEIRINWLTGRVSTNALP